MKDTFRFNKKRKHYCYVFKVTNGRCLNILLTTDPEAKRKDHKRTRIVKNIRLYRHPNPNSNITAYLYNHRPYNDSVDSLDNKKLKWGWDINDKRKVKRMKKYDKYNKKADEL